MEKAFNLSVSMLFLILILFACNNDEDFNNNDYPIIYTQPITEITSSYTTFTAKVLTSGNQTIEDHGFVWSLNPNPDLNSQYKISLGTYKNKSQFSTNVFISDLQGCSEYYVRAFVKTANLIYYGVEQSFVLNPEINNIIPKEGCRGIELAIVGHSFKLNMDDCKILIDNYPCEIVGATKDTMWFKIDSLIDEGVKDITIEFEKGSVTKKDLYSHHEPWEKLENFIGVERYHAISFSIGTKAYIGGGIDKDYNKLNDFWEYIPEQNEWVKRADLPINIKSPEGASFSTSNYGYIGVNKNFWQYDPTMDKWNKIKEFPGEAISYQSVFVINEKVFLGSGRTEAYATTSELWIYDETSDSWEQKTNLPFSTEHGIDFSINGLGYMGSLDTGDFWEYDPLTNSWCQKNNFLSDLNYFAIGVSTNDKGYIFDTNITLEYDPESGVWNKMLLMPAIRIFPVVFSLNDKCYIGTGYNNDVKATNDFYIYDPSKDILSEIMP